MPRRWFLAAIGALSLLAADDASFSLNRGYESFAGGAPGSTCIRKCSCAVLRTPALRCIRLRWRRCADAVNS
jgi:hypothetical protein